MFLTKTKKKRSAPKAPPTRLSSTASSQNVLTGLLDCYNFMSYNEYSEKTFGLLAFLTRKSVGEINFSEIIDEADKRRQHGQSIDLGTLLKEKRTNLFEIEASIEKCLMLNRLISYKEENEAHFNQMISDIRLEMKSKMEDNQTNQTIQYPNDFRQREKDFAKRRNAQQIRRLFFLSNKEAKEPPSLIHLQNRTTEHLGYLLDCKMRYDSKFSDTGLKELERILLSSFMVVTEPHSSLIPVTIYERKGPGEYIAKVSVIIVSLLHDFMQTHPNLIELYDIEPSMWPLSPHYKLAEPRSITWKTCHLQACLGDKPRMIKYAELTFITIQQSCTTATRVHFAQALHSLKFTIKLHLNLSEYGVSKTYQIPLQTLPFGIGNHNNQIPQLLTRVILEDAKRLSKPQSIDVSTIMNLMQRYFVHRTGVEPNECSRNYLGQELNKAMEQRKNLRILEDIFMDFLVPYIHQVEFMAKHPILAMLHADGLFLGICNSERAAEVMMQSADINSSIIGFRFNSFKVDYNVIEKVPALKRTVKLNSCAIRADVYNNHKKRVQYFTFDSSILSIDISEFVSSTVRSEKANRLQALSYFDDKTNRISYKSCIEFKKYYDDHLRVIYRPSKKYKHIANLIDNIDDDDNNEERISDTEIQNTELVEPFPANPYSITPVQFDYDQNSNATSVDGYMPMSYNGPSNHVAPSQNIIPPSAQQQSNHRKLLQYIFSQPQLLAEIVDRLNILSFAAPSQQQQQQQQFYQLQTQIPYQNQQPQFSYQQQPSPVIFQQSQVRPIYQQLPICPPMNSYQPNNVNQSQEFQFFGDNGIDSTSQQRSPQIQILQMSDDDSTQSTIDSFQFMMTDEMPFDQDL